MTSPGLRDGTRIAVTGSATAEELAAVVIALDAALAEDAPPPAGRSGWLEAARREAVGGRLVLAREDLTG